MPVNYTACEYKKTSNCSIKADVYPAEQKNSPVLVYIHGGALIFGNRKLEHGSYPLNTLLSHNFSVVSIDYRLAPETKLEFIVQDVRDALDWVRGEGARLFGFDPEKVAVMGSSAGGYLSLMSGTLKNRPNVIASYYGYGDILGEWYTKPDSFYLKQQLVTEDRAYRCVGKEETTDGGGLRWEFYLYSRQKGLWPALVSGVDQDRERDKIMPFCPIENIENSYPPTILLHGDADTDVPVEQSINMHEALKNKNIESKLRIYHNGNHGFTFHDEPEARSIFDEALDFIKQHIL